jgi:uncharacterized protein YjbJ (UPF0337 family)
MIRNEGGRMALNSDVLKGKFTELKGEIRKQWGELTDDEVTKTKGNAESLAGLVQQRYGIAKEQAESEVQTWMAKAQEKLAKVADSANDKIDNMKEKIKPKKTEY